MAGSVNKVILVGNLGRDPEVRHTQDGSKIVHLSVATSERWRDRSSGENRERTEWHRVVIFNERLGEVADQQAAMGGMDGQAGGGLPPLEQVREAHALLESNSTFGKVVLVM